MNPNSHMQPDPDMHTRLKGNQNHCSDLAGGLEAEAKIPDTGDHGSLPQWSGTRPEAAGSSYRALWQFVRAPLSCSQSCAGEAAEGRKGRLTGSRLVRIHTRKNHATRSWLLDRNGR